MLKRLLRTTLWCTALLCGSSLFGQAGDYTFSVSTSTYTPLGATATAVDILADTKSDTVPIGFDFYFEGVAYDSASVASDGFLSFVVGASSTLSNDLDNGSSVRRPLVAPLWDDHDGRAFSSAASYELSGTAPNRVFTFEWTNWEWSYNATDSVVSFQVKLYETTNVIEFTYNWECSSCITSPDASIGLSGASTFLSVTGVGSGTPTASNSIEDASIDTVVSNQVFTFTPPSCTTPSYTGASVVTSNTITIDWTHATATSFEVNWDTTGFTQGATGSTTASVSTNTYSASGLTPGQSYDFYIRTDCGAGVYSNWSGPYTVTTAYVPTYIEDWSNGYPNDWTEAAGLIANPTVFSNTSSSTWSSDGFSNNGFAGAARVNIWSTGADEWLISPSIDLGTGTTTYQFEFDASLTPYSSTSSSTLGIDDSVKVVISTDNGATWNNANTLLTLDNSTTIPNGAGSHYIINLAGYTGIVKFAFYAESTVSNADNDFFIDNVKIREVPACPEPQFLADSNITTSSIDLGWQSAGSGPWYIYWGPCGFDQASSGVTVDTVTTNPYTTMSGLASNTSYQFYLFEDCGAQGLSDTVDFGCVTTDCGPISVPFVEGFNSYSLTEHCWTVLNLNNDADAWNTDYGTNPFEGDEVAMMYTDFNNGNNNDWLISPPLALTANERVKFQYRVQSSGEPNDFMLLASTTGTNAADFTDTLLPLASYSNTTYQEIMVNLNAYNGTTYLAWHVPAGGLDGWRLYIDQVVVEAIPPCPSSSGLTASAIGNDSIQITWTPGGSATAYGIEYGPEGFTPGTGLTMGTTDTFDVANGLMANATYDFYVYDTCSSGTSVALGPLTVTTLCNNIVAPYLETFDGASWVAGSAFGAGDTIDGCWSRNSETGYKWSVLNTGTGSTNTGPDADHTGSGGNFLYTEASSSTPALALLTTPNIDVSGLTTPYVSFWYHRYGTAAAMGDMLVEIYDRNGWDTLMTITGVQQTASTDPYLEIGVDISAYGDTVQLRFTGVQKATYQGDMAIDDFSVDEAPTCLPILNLTADGIVDTAATFRWDGTSTATSYEVWFGPQGFYQGTATVGGTKVITQYDSLLVDSLSDLTCYEFVVRGICGPGDTTAWVGPYSFCTPPTCPQPTALGVDLDQLTINSADIYWTTGGSSDFNVEYGPAGFTQGGGTMMNAANDTVSLSSLSPGTEYEFYVRDSCGAGDVSLWSGPFSFVTAFTTNYLEDYTLNNPFAWTEADGRLLSTTSFTASSSSWTNDQFGNIGSNSQKVNIWLGNQYEWLISPSIYLDPTITNLQVEFDAAITAYSNTNQGYLGSDDTLAIVISTDNGKTWTNTNILWYTDANDTVAAAGEHVIVPLTGYSGYVRFGVYAGSVVDDTEDNDWFIDNFEVRTPRACDPPSALGIADIKTDSALVYWTEGTAGFINAEVIYTVGNQPASAGTVVNSTNDSVYLSGLTNATNYCVYVVEECSNGYSDTLGPVCFTTLCLPQSLPYFEDFNTSLGCFTPIDGGSTDDTWMHVQNYNTNTLDGTPFAFVDSDAPGSGNTLSEILVSVQLDASNISGPLVLQYDQYFNNIGADSAIVEVFDGTSWIQVAGYASDQGAFGAPDHDSIDISAYANANLQVRFRYEDFNVWAWYWAVDNVSIMEMSSCPTPSNVAVGNASCDSVEVSWTSDATATGSYIEYGAKGFALGSGTVIPNVTSPWTLNGLMMDTEYDVYVVDSCSMVASNPSQALSFETDSVGPVLASFSYTQTSTTLTDADVDYDGSASAGDGLTYDWDFGNGSTGSGVNAQANYTANGTYNVVLTVTDRCGNTDDTTIVITVAGISIVENDYNAAIEMYPNPSNGTFKVNVSQGSGLYDLEVMDLSGKVIYKQNDLAPGTPETIELNNVADGVYMVRLVGEGLNVTQRILID